MINYTQEKIDKSKVIKKLVARWISKQETRLKADLLLAKNPEIRARKSSAAVRNRA